MTKSLLRGAICVVLEMPDLGIFISVSALICKDDLEPLSLIGSL